MKPWAVLGNCLHELGNTSKLAAAGNAARSALCCVLEHHQMPLPCLLGNVGDWLQFAVPGVA